MDLSDAAALERFRAYLRMRTDHPSPSSGYGQAVAWLRELAAAGGFEFDTFELSPGHPLAIITWPGTQPQLPSLVLNSHMDVVPAEVAKWSVDPWGAELRDGRVYGRGTQDMKSVGAQYIEALLRLKAAGFAPTRTVHALYVPDEEVGGGRGIKLLLADPLLVRRLNAGLVLDEGLASDTQDGRMTVFYGEKKIWWLRVRATGVAGHGSRLMPGTAVPKLLRVVNAALAYRAEQAALLEGGSGDACGCGKTLQDVTALNCTLLSAGDATREQYNVVPTLATAGFDVRIPVTQDLDAFRARVSGWCAEDGVGWELVAGTDERSGAHAVSACEGYEWELFGRAAAAAGVELHAPAIFPAATDSRWIRLALGIPAFGFSPIARTPVLLHDHDEYITVDGFTRGIAIYEAMLRVLCADAAVWPQHAAAAAASSEPGSVGR